MNSLVLLCGCGLGDGSCIEEVVLTYLALEHCQCSYQVVALDAPMTAVNHLSEQEEEQRNVLTESARIGRGSIQELRSVSLDDFDCLVIPGGIGLFRNYADQEPIQALLHSFLEQQKPIATMCAGIDFLRSFLGSDFMQKECASLSAQGFCRAQSHSVYYTPAFRKSVSLCDVQKGISGMIEALTLDIANTNQKGVK